MEHALVSVIIPIYKVSEYLDNCVQSACDQTYSNLEIILVDDGSPDDCPAKCDSWAKKDARIKVIHKPNGGLSDARNAGLDVATGKYIYFLDGDDSIKPELVETVLKYMENGADMVAFRYDTIFPDGHTKAVLQRGQETYELNTLQVRREFIVQKLLTCKIGWEAWSRMYSRELIEKYNLRFADNRVIFAEDLYFCLCYCAHVERIVSISNSLYRYTLRENSIMGRDGVKLNVGRMNELAKAALHYFRKWEDCKLLVDCFPAIHYMIVDNVLSKAIWNTQLPPQEFRQLVLNDIEDFPFFKSQMQLVPQYSNDLSWCFSGGQVAERISYMRYILDGNYTLFRLRNRIIYQFWDFLNRNSDCGRVIGLQYQNLKKTKRRVFLLGTEEFGNTGDHQINESVVAFLHQALPDHLIQEVTLKQWQMHKPFLKKYIRSNDLIVFAGGGNFGDTYPAAQNLRTEVIRLWPCNPKIVFPQTIYFSDSEKGKDMLAEAKMLYTRENHVALFAREQPSFAFAQTHFSCESYLAPDIVLSSDVPQGTNREHGILLCFRRDEEKSMSAETASAIENLCRLSGFAAEYTDLQLDYDVDREFRKQMIEEKMEQWRKVKLVITDRLHGMVFAAITGTPCIVFSNFNHKVRGTYEWIKYLPYIRYAETVKDVERYLPELLEMENCRFDNTPLLPYFEKLAQVVKGYANH